MFYTPSPCCTDCIVVAVTTLVGYVRNYYNLASFREATQVMQNACRKGNEVLYADGGQAIRRWVESG